MAVLDTKQLTRTERENLARLDAKITALELILPKNPEVMDDYIETSVQLSTLKYNLIEEYDLLDEATRYHIYFDVTCGIIMMEDF